MTCSVVALVNELDRGRGAGRLGDLKLAVADFAQFQPADLEHFPDIDDHVGMAHEKQVQVRVAIDHSGRHATEDADVRQHGVDLGAVFGGELVEGDRPQGVAPGRIAGGGLKRAGREPLATMRRRCRPPAERAPSGAQASAATPAATQSAARSPPAGSVSRHRPDFPMFTPPNGAE